MNHDLNKVQKKIARQIIEKGLQKEFEQGLTRASQLLHLWKSGVELDNRKAWHKLYNSVINHDKHIAGRYDHMTGSKYLLIIAAQLADGIINQEDLREFDEGIRKKILLLSERNF